MVNLEVRCMLNSGGSRDTGVNNVYS